MRLEIFYSKFKMANLNQKYAKMIKFFAIQCSDIPNLLHVTKVEWYKALIANVIVSCAQSYRQDTEWL
jgi:hypothetical protein